MRGVPVYADRRQVQPWLFLRDKWHQNGEISNTEHRQCLRPNINKKHLIQVCLCDETAVLLIRGEVFEIFSKLNDYGSHELGPYGLIRFDTPVKLEYRVPVSAQLMLIESRPPHHPTNPRLSRDQPANGPGYGPGSWAHARPWARG
jgi:hypothetical protein